MDRILYYSTNRLSPHITFQEALIKGLAPDGGLYMPGRIPKIKKSEFNNFRESSYPEIASAVLWKFLEGEMRKSTLDNICEEAYNFKPLLETIEPDLSIMRLDSGPTASFKDFAACLMARLIKHFNEETEKKIVILTATSGDTGSAVANAFLGMEGIRVVLLYPEKEVSDLQRKQMTTLGENVTALAVDGKFDDCQLMVKAAFKDRDLESLTLSSANSINIGRLLPQMIYYFYAVSRLSHSDEELIFSIPSGNFGNMMGGVLAREMGLAIGKFVIAVNENDEFSKYLLDGTYTKIEPSIDCISSAMNVGHPSNLVRLIDIYGGRMNEAGLISRKPRLLNLKKDLWSVSISDKLTMETIRNVWDQFNVLLEPHGAVAWAGLELYNIKKGYDKSIHKVIIETAHPSKFPEIIKQVLGFQPEVSKSLMSLADKKENIRIIPANYAALKEYLLAI
ncbi:MAG: threonine synthase [Bacteroidales bacterium]|nr:threonine synthase [Bacteroidales bacterium]